MPVEIPRGKTRIFEALPPQAQECIRSLLYQVHDVTGGKFIAVVLGDPGSDINIRLVFEEENEIQRSLQAIIKECSDESGPSQRKIDCAIRNHDGIEWDFRDEDGYSQEKKYPSLVLQLTPGLVATVSVAGPEIWRKIEKQGLVPSYEVWYQWPVEDKVALQGGGDL